MKKLKNYIDDLFKDFPINEETQKIKTEIIQNLEEKVSYLIENGKSEEDAINKTIVEFGDIEELKENFGTLNTEIKSKKKSALLNLQFSLYGSGLIIALFLFINFYYTPKSIWVIYPIFGILWWPLTMYFNWKRKK